MAEAAEMKMESLHKLVFQFFVARGAASEGDAVKFITKCHGAEALGDVDDPGAFVDSVRATINHNIAPMSLTLQTGRYDEDGAQYWALVNSAQDEIAKVACGLSEDQVLFFKHVLKLIMDKDGEISKKEALAGLKRGTSVAEGTQTLDLLIRTQWLREAGMGDFWWRDHVHASKCEESLKTTRSTTASSAKSPFSAPSNASTSRSALPSTTDTARWIGSSRNGKNVKNVTRNGFNDFNLIVYIIGNTRSVSFIPTSTVKMERESQGHKGVPA